MDGVAGWLGGWVGGQLGGLCAWRRSLVELLVPLLAPFLSKSQTSCAQFLSPPSAPPPPPPPPMPLPRSPCRSLYFIYLGIAAFVAAYAQVAFWTLTGERARHGVRQCGEQRCKVQQGQACMACMPLSLVRHLHCRTRRVAAAEAPADPGHGCIPVPAPCVYSPALQACAR